MFDPHGWTVGYDRHGHASIGQLHMAPVHMAVPVAAWVACEPEPMTWDAALALANSVNVLIVAHRVAARTCPTCGRVAP